MKHSSCLQDVQSQPDQRNIPLQQVGIRDLRRPLSLMDQSRGLQQVAATVALAVSLPCEQRGVHMSRFIEALNQWTDLSPANLRQVLTDICDRLEARQAWLDVSFPYFVDCAAPVSGITAPLDLYCRLRACLNAAEQLHTRISVSTPIHILCPCSREISSQGAHNQRATATLEIEPNGSIWFEELAAAANQGSSVPIYPLLKRPDEKFVTETAYANPRFVEDAAREIALALQNLPAAKIWRVQVESMESIHNHSAYALVQSDNWEELP